jgi:DNA-binding transcriptional regulator YiaG
MHPENTVQIRTLRRAADTLGGVGELAALLNTSEDDVRRWIQGMDRPPQVAFLKALDIVARGPGRQP